jgi:hypothetical protein
LRDKRLCLLLIDRLALELRRFEHVLHLRRDVVPLAGLRRDLTLQLRISRVARVVALQGMS